MILTEHGIRFAKDGDHFYFVEYPNLAMLRVERDRVGGEPSAHSMMPTPNAQLPNVPTREWLTG